MKQLHITVLFIILLSTNAMAQYTQQGKIEYERKTNLKRQIDDMGSDNDWAQAIKSQIPKFKSDFFDLYFTLSKTVYKPGRKPEGNDVVKMWGSEPAGENIVYTDFSANNVIASKQVYEQKFLVQDSIRKIKWKITDEIRTIANFKCRKAVGKICDSVYVVAFYTDDIMVSGGPEMFGGLPGMILELAVPRLYTTWVADKVEITESKADEIGAPEKGKKVNQKQFYDALQLGLKDWGKYAAKSIWWCTL